MKPKRFENFIKKKEINHKQNGAMTKKIFN